MFWQNFKEFMARPFSPEDMDWKDWFFFMGLIIMIMVAWGMIFRHIKEIT